jgi:hypothetical protein
MSAVVLRIEGHVQHVRTTGTADGVTDKTPYAKIMKVVLFFQKFTVRTWKPKPSHVRPLLIELEKYA